MPLDTGQVLEDKYRIVRLIGQGGMGAVYEGENTRIRRRVAIKILHAIAAENPELIARFEHEAQAAGQIGSDHILEVLDLGVLPDGDRYLVMEYLDGEPLSERIHRRGRLVPGEAIPMIAQVLSGLAAAHHVGIVHRDLKPENIFILKEKAGQPDFVKIIDFGISKFQSTGGEMRMTRTGAVLGTPYYMSPEQASGKSVDFRSDLYSVGVILYEALTGRTPFEAKSYNELILKIVLSAPDPIGTLIPDLPHALCAIVETAMAREPEQRFQSAEEFGQALLSCAVRGGQTVALGDALGMGTPPGLPSFPMPDDSDSSGIGWGPQGHGSAYTPNPTGPGLHSGQQPIRPSLQMRYQTPAGTPTFSVSEGAPGHGTVSGSMPGGAWSQTGSEMLLRRPRRGRWIAVSALGILACVGGAFGIVRLAGMNSNDTTPVTSAARPSDEANPTDRASQDPKEMPQTGAAGQNAISPEAGSEALRDPVITSGTLGAGLGPGLGAGLGNVHTNGPSASTATTTTSTGLRPVPQTPKPVVPPKRPPRPAPPQPQAQPQPQPPKDPTPAPVPTPPITGVGGLGY